MQLNQNGIPGLDDYRQRYESALVTYAKHLSQVVEHDGYEQLEASLNLVSDQELRERVQEIVASKQTGELKYIFVVGIGGSHLGTQAVYDALYGAFDAFQLKRYPKMYFVDTVNARALYNLQRFIQENVSTPQEVLMNVISKSGGTTETMVNAELVLSYLDEVLGRDARDRIVVTTDKDSRLWQQAQSQNLSALSLPEMVGGRYSVLSAVGLFPLAAAGIDIEDLHRGARDMREQCIDGSFDKNPAMQSSLAIYKAHQNGACIHDTFLFHTELESMGKWYRQLTGESLGKEEDRDGNTVHAGITPTVSLGSSDLHSVAQLYLGGPNDKITTFVRAQLDTDTQTLPQDGLFSSLVDESQGYSADEIMDAILEGVKIAYQKQNLLFMDVLLDDISAYSIGQFFQFKMCEIMYLAQLINVNAFNQPNVELYKTETKRILNKQS